MTAGNGGGHAVDLLDAPGRVATVLRRCSERPVGLWVIRGLAIVAALVLWQVVAIAAESLYFPPPLDVIRAVWDDWLIPFGDTWSDNVAPSLWRLLGGYLLAAVLSVVVGVAIGRSRTLAQYVEPSIHFIRAIPPPALLPLFIVLLGIEDTMKVALIATGVFPPILLNTIAGVRAVDPLFLDTAESFRISPFRRITHVILPAAAPKIFAGLRVSLSIAVILMVISELYAATNGVGFRILQAQRLFKMVDLWAGLVVLGLFGVVLNGVLALIERQVLRWDRT
jgi:ABC-type nitrate/sulfonate/bicarbonate transport system permease component